MGKKDNKTKTFNNCLLEAKSDMILYFVILGILIITSVILYILYGEPVLYTFIAFVLFHLIFTIDKIVSYKNVLRIKKYLVNNNLESKLGNIIFWNEKNYFLTNNFIIIVKNSKVNCFSYQDIKSISKKSDVKIGKYNSGVNEYLIIELKDNRKLEILTWSTYLVGEEYKDISDILLEKNSRIDVVVTKE